MKTEYTNQIVYNEHKIFYMIKSYDGNTLRIEQLKKQPYNCEAISIHQLQAANKRLNIIYYGYEMYDKKVMQSEK